jgi:hypothetical protein
MMSLPEWFARLNKTHPHISCEISADSTCKLEGKFVCDKHGQFISTLFKVCRSKHGCPNCVPARNMPRTHFIDQVNKHNVLNQIVIIPDDVKSTSDINVLCNQHGWFTISINNFKAGSNCRKCGIESSSLKQSGKVRIKANVHKTT